MKYESKSIVKGGKLVFNVIAGFAGRLQKGYGGNGRRTERENLT